MNFRAESTELDFYDDTPRGRLAKLPFGILFIILMTGMMSYFLENRPSSTITAHEKVIQVMAQRQPALAPSKQPGGDPARRPWILLGTALFVQGLAGAFAVKVFRRPKPRVNGRPHFQSRN